MARMTFDRSPEPSRLFGMPALPQDVESTPATAKTKAPPKRGFRRGFKSAVCPANTQGECQALLVAKDRAGARDGAKGPAHELQLASLIAVNPARLVHFVRCAAAATALGPTPPRGPPHAH